MSHAARPVPPHAPGSTAALDRAQLIVQHEQRNFLILVWYQIVLRVGWIFKTESIIMPAFLDFVGGTAWMRGCLPLLNRFGQSVPPALLSRRLKVTPLKRRALARSTTGMAVPFLVLAAIWLVTEGKTGAWMPWVFLIAYGIFFAITGFNQLALNTLQGKLIQPARRGRLMSMATTFGCPLAILAAYWLMGPWLESPIPGFGYTFGICGVMFLIALVVTFFLVEPADNFEEPALRPHEHFTAAWKIIRHDAHFRRLAIVAALFSMVLMLFPHYEALGRLRLQLPLGNLVYWVMLQNAGTGIFSLIAGPIADRHGTRRALGIILLLCTSMPLLAVALVWFDPELGRKLYWLVFLPTGLTPVALRTLTNYTLEIAPPHDHPRYVSTMNLCVSGPILLFSPLLGLLIEMASFELVFLFGTLVILAAALLVWRLHEPRLA